jgi:hypothetical protein
MVLSPLSRAEHLMGVPHGGSDPGSLWEGAATAPYGIVTVSAAVHWQVSRCLFLVLLFAVAKGSLSQPILSEPVGLRAAVMLQGHRFRMKAGMLSLHAICF